jgi:TRAP-type C4-dicarboxylate transport system substrate-binding protein
MRIGLAVACLVAWSQPAAAEEMRIATLAPSGTPWMEALERAAAEIAERTENRVTVKYFPGGQMGDERDFVRKIKLGQLDGAAVTAMGLAMIEPSILVLQLPMLFATEDELDYVATKMWPYFQKKFEKQGFRLAERGELGWVYFFSKAKVTSMADLRKQKLWTLGDDNIGSTLLDKLKLNGVPLGVPEVDAALTSGKINACFSSPLGAIALQWYSKVKFMSARPICGPTAGIQQVVAVSGESWANSYAMPTGGTKLTRPLVTATASLRIALLENFADITVGAFSTTPPQKSTPKGKRKARGFA